MSVPASVVDEPKTPPPAHDQGFIIRIFILGTIFAVALGAFVFDRMQWSQAKAMNDRLLNLNKEEGFKSTNVTRDQIHDLIGFKPTSEEAGEKENKIKETFQWLRGFPGRTYDLIVEYDKHPNGKVVFSTVQSVGIEAGEELPPEAPGNNNPPAALPPGPPGPRGGTEEKPSPMGADGKPSTDSKEKSGT